MLKKRVGEGLTVELVSGTDFPEDLSSYDLVIQCGACMFNRKYVLSRIERAKKAAGRNDKLWCDNRTPDGHIG